MLTPEYIGVISEVTGVPFAVAIHLPQVSLTCGIRRPNMPRFLCRPELGALTSVAIATAYRPYWARSTSATFRTFGSTIGSDAGINLFHEFGPGIRQW